MVKLHLYLNVPFAVCAARWAVVSLHSLAVADPAEPRYQSPNQQAYAGCQSSLEPHGGVTTRVGRNVSG